MHSSPLCLYKDGDNMTEEIWKDIPGYEGEYQASSKGQIKSLKRMVPCKGGYRCVSERLLKQHIKDKCGHLGVSLRARNQGFCVYRAVALAFIGVPEEGQEVLHINGNPKDNRPENLRYGTRRENILDVYYQGKRWKQLNIDDVQTIKFALFCGFSSKELSKEFNVSISTINDIKRGRRYGWLK